MYRKAPKPLKLRDIRAEDTSEDTSDDTSEGTSDTSEGTSDDGSKSNILSAVEEKANELKGKAKEMKEQAAKKFNTEKRLAKLQAKKNWDALKAKIIREGEAADALKGQIKAELKKAKKEAKQAWKDLKWKIRNGNDILQDMMASENEITQNASSKRGSTEPAMNASIQPSMNSSNLPSTNASTGGPSVDIE